MEYVFKSERGYCPQCVAFGKVYFIQDRMIEYDGVKYVWNSKTKELREHTEPKQETGYCNTYLECLNMAKDILKKKEIESTGIQMSLLS